MSDHWFCCLKLLQSVIKHPKFGENQNGFADLFMIKKDKLAHLPKRNSLIVMIHYDPPVFETTINQPPILPGGSLFLLPARWLLVKIRHSQELDG